jgi:hypothetical protein
VIEYLTKPNYIADAKGKLDQLGFVMYTGPRGLGELIDPNGPRRGPLDPSPENPSAQTLGAKASRAATKAGEAVKQGAANVKAKAKELINKKQ